MPQSKIKLPRTEKDDLCDMADSLEDLMVQVGGTCLVCGLHEHDKMCPVYRWQSDRDNCESGCEFVVPFGFVIESDCEVHDKKEE